MLEETLLKISGHSHIPLTLRGETFNKVNVIKQDGPPSLKLPRASCFAQRALPNPAKHLSAKQDGGGGEIRTHEAFRAFRFSRPARSTALPPLRPERVRAARAIHYSITCLLQVESWSLGVVKAPEKTHALFQSEQSQPRSFSSRSISPL